MAHEFIWRDDSEVVLVAEGLGRVEVATSWMARGDQLERVLRLTLLPRGNSRGRREFVAILTSASTFELEEQFDHPSHPLQEDGAETESYDGTGMS